MRKWKHNHNKIRSNQQGSTLLMVIICLAFIGILGSLMLSVSMVNLRMKKVENASKGNFYTCEKALEEIRAGLEELSAKSIQNTYEVVLSKYVLYSAMDDATRNQKIQDLVLTNLNTAVGNNTVDIATDFKKFLSNSSDYTITIGTKTTSNIASPYTNIMTFSNVRIEYNQGDYKTAIISDLKITLPSFIFSKTADDITYSMQQPYEGYAVVADGNIISDNAAGSNSITGNLYSGLGIRVKDTDLNQNHTLTLKGNYIVTRGNISVEDTGTLIIGHRATPPDTDDNLPLVWADNLQIDTTGSYPVTSDLTTTLDVNAICLMRDDLSLNGQNSNAIFSGAYLGYTNAHTAEGSAILVNGAGTNLDLTGLSSLVLAGRAHVYVEDDLRKLISTDSDINIMTGESLALKSNQRAYLVPGKYIFLDDGTTEIAAWRNPLTQKDLESATARVDITTTSDTNVVNCFAYIKEGEEQYKNAAKQLVSPVSTLLYYYLNFKSGKHADQYLVDYMGKYPNHLQVFNAFSLSGVQLPEVSNIVSAGNVMYYDKSNYPDAPVQYVQGKSSDYVDDVALDDYISKFEFNDSIYSGTILAGKEINNLSDIYFNLTHYLTPDSDERHYEEGTPVVASTVLQNGINQVKTTMGGYALKSPGFTFYNSLSSNTWISTEDTAKSIVVLSGDAVIATGSRFNGVFITTGNVTIGEGAVINGIVIAAGNGTTGIGDILVQSNANIIGRLIAVGNVTLQENCSINCDANTTFDPTLSVNTFLANIFTAESDILWRMFTNPVPTVNIDEGSTSLDLVDINNLVTFENWRMSE